MTINQAKDSVNRQASTFIRGNVAKTITCRVIAKTRGGLLIRFDADNSDGFFAWRYTWPFDVIAT